MEINEEEKRIRAVGGTGSPTERSATLTAQFDRNQGAKGRRHRFADYEIFAAFAALSHRQPLPLKGPREAKIHGY
jgi:hypothetical protein